MTLTEAEIDKRALALLAAQGWTPNVFDLRPGTPDREHLEATFAWQRARLAVQLDEIKLEVSIGMGRRTAAIYWRAFVWYAWVRRRLGLDR